MWDYGIMWDYAICALCLTAEHAPLKEEKVAVV